MNGRFLLAAFLVVVGAGLTIGAMATHGTPWSFRGHAAVLVETSGAVEIQAGEPHMSRDGLSEAALSPMDGLFLEPKDEVRVARLAEARLKLENGTVALTDSTRAFVEEHGVTLVKGLVEVTVPAGTRPFSVKVTSPVAEILIRPAGTSGRARILADGRNEIRAWVIEGSAEGITSAGSTNVETGKVLAINGEKAAVINSTGKPMVRASCDGAQVVVEAPPATQVFVLQTLAYPDNGKVTLPVADRTSVPVLVREVAGAATLVDVPCKGAAPAPPRRAPGPAPAPAPGPAPPPTPTPAPTPGATPTPAPAPAAPAAPPPAAPPPAAPPPAVPAEPVP